MHSNTQQVIDVYFADPTVLGPGPTQRRREITVKMASEIAEARDIFRQLAVLSMHIVKHGECSRQSRLNVMTIYNHCQAFLKIYEHKEK